ncbi:MAG: glycosyltransferase [Steroidobacteraceae bacterium]|jgi:glycosyltransferase involved in cell wall biosynthesis|nr:glycosyltransferase [Steroidobacteraceae bacterium]
MRILHALLSSGFAGTERATAEMCNALCDAHEVALAVRRGHRSRAGASIVDHLDPRVQRHELGDWFPGRGLARLVREWRPDVIHTHLRKSTRLVARLRPPCPAIATLHMWVNGPHFLQMDGLVVIAQWQKKDLAPYRGRVFDINESLVPHPRLDAARIAQLRAAAGAAPGEFLVGGVGRLAHSKGFDLLVRAFREAALPGARLVLVGDGRERAALEALAAGLPVRFLGFRDDAKDFYQAFDLFVSPSRSEPLGRVLFEALDAGVPVLATRTQGPSEILARFPGRLVPVEDVAAMAAALRELAAAPPPRLAHDLSDYHLPNVLRATEAAYRELLEARRG